MEGKTLMCPSSKHHAPLPLTNSRLQPVVVDPERKRSDMEFLDMNLTKDLSLLLSAIHSLFDWRILQKTILYYGFKTPYQNKKIKKIRETRKLEPEKTQVYAQKPRLKLSFKNSTSGLKGV
jgi:hypothetical protein